MKGFTVIELLITVAIVAVLALVAIPTYQHHVIKARVSEGLQMVGPAKMAVSEVASVTRIFPANQSATEYTSPEPTVNVASIVIADASGEVIITYTPVAGNGTIIFKPTIQLSGQVTWACTGGSLLSIYRPASCR